VTEAAEVSEAADAALFTQQSVRAVLGSDVRSALDRLELVDSALATLRRREIERWSSEPAEYVVALLGPARAIKAARNGGGRHRRDRGLATVRWRQRWLRLAERLTRALGPPSEVGRAEGADASSRTLRRCDAISVSRRPIALGPLTPVLCSTGDGCGARAR